MDSMVVVEEILRLPNDLQAQILFQLSSTDLRDVSQRYPVLFSPRTINSLISLKRQSLIQYSYLKLSDYEILAILMGFWCLQVKLSTGRVYTQLVEDPSFIDGFNEGLKSFYGEVKVPFSAKSYLIHGSDVVSKFYQSTENNLIIDRIVITKGRQNLYLIYVDPQDVGNEIVYPPPVSDLYIQGLYVAVSCQDLIPVSTNWDYPYE